LLGRWRPTELLGFVAELAVVGSAALFALTASNVAAQSTPQAAGEARVTAWAPKPAALPDYVGVHRPHRKLADLLASHAGESAWSETLVDDRHVLAKYVSMGPGERTPRRFHPDTRTFWVVQRGGIRFTIEGQEPFVASQGFLVQVPYRTTYAMETVGDVPSLRLEVMVAGATTFYPLDVTPVPVPGIDFVAVTVPGRGRYDEGNRPYVDFRGDIVERGARAGTFVRDDRLFATIIRGHAEPPPPDDERGHVHVEYGELWLILEGKIDYLIEGLPFFTADEGDVVYVPAGRFHRPTFGGTGMATRLGINGFYSGVHVEPLPQH
jgi:mannose-6-phosphate isomerase-like protein (cupin superfamily)